MLQKILITAIMVLPAASVLAATPHKPWAENVPVNEFKYPYMTDEQFAAQKKWAVEYGKKRMPQSDVVDEESALSAELKNLRNRIIGGPIYQNGAKTRGLHSEITKSAELSNLIDELDSSFDSLPNDAKLVAAPLIALKPFRGITVRMRPLFTKHHLVHATVVTSLRVAATGVNVFLPTAQWKAGFKYVTEPFNGMRGDIANDGDFFRWVAVELKPSLEKYITRIGNINLEKPVYWDNKIAYKTANFVSDSDRFLLIGEAERKSWLSGLFLAHSAICSSLAYSWDGLFDVVQDVANIYGFQQVFKVEGATAEERTRKILKYNHRLFVKNNRADKYLPVAFSSLKEGLRQARVSWNILQQNKDNPNAFQQLLDPRAFVPFSRIINTSFDNIESLVEGNGVKSAIVGGEVVDVDFQRFFGKDAPENLLEFLPTGFEPGPAEFTPGQDKLATSTHKPYRNYMRGAPAHWNTEVWSRYFPKIRGDSDVRGAARILSQSWGGWILGIPLSAMVL